MHVRVCNQFKASMPGWGECRSNVVIAPLFPWRCQLQEFGTQHMHTSVLYDNASCAGLIWAPATHLVMSIELN